MTIWIAEGSGAARAGEAHHQVTDLAQIVPRLVEEHGGARRSTASGRRER
ncbi:hypothetical protein [Streptomyces sp. Caat 7-52]|nr:hypothetical protein [Streptomyces sp. Caat 7-52]